MYEELLIGNTSLATNHPKIFKAEEDFIPWSELKIEIKYLEKLLEKNDLENIIKILKKLVIGYNPPQKIVDYVFNEKLNKNIKES